MEIVTVHTREKEEMIDLTEIIDTHVQECGTKEGVCHIMLQETTCAIMLLDKSFLEPDSQKIHGGLLLESNIKLISSLMGVIVSVPFSEGKLQVSEEQRIVLMEMDGPKKRSLVVSILGEK